MNRARLLSTDCTSGRLAEWGNRYLPAELTGSTLAYLSAMGAFSLTFDPFWAATAAVAGEATGFYGVMLVRQARRRQHTATHLPLLRVLVAALHDLMLEFGPAELLDTLLVRPLMIYASLHLFTNVWLGMAMSKVVADIIFYVPAIAIYEGRKRSLLRAVPAPHLGKQRKTTDKKGLRWSRGPLSKSTPAPSARAASSSFGGLLSIAGFAAGAQRSNDKTHPQISQMTQICRTEHR